MEKKIIKNVVVDGKKYKAVIREPELFRLRGTINRLTCVVRFYKPALWFLGNMEYTTTIRIEQDPNQPYDYSSIILLAMDEFMDELEERKRKAELEKVALKNLSEWDGTINTEKKEELIHG